MVERSADYCAESPINQAEHFNAAKQLSLKCQKKMERVVIMTFLIDESCMKFPTVDPQNRRCEQQLEHQTHYDFYVAEKKKRGFEFCKYQLETSTGRISECPIKFSRVKGPSKLSWNSYRKAALSTISRIVEREQWNEWVSASEESIEKEEGEDYDRDKQKRRKLFWINFSAPV